MITEIALAAISLITTVPDEAKVNDYKGAIEVSETAVENDWVYLSLIDPDSYPVYEYEDISEKEMGELTARLPQQGCGTWQFFGATPNKYSGWKIHIPGKSIKDSVTLYEKLSPVVNKWQVPAKVGGVSNSSIQGYWIDPDHIQYGKAGAVLYVPPKIFSDTLQVDLLRDVEEALSGYSAEGIKINGDRQFKNYSNISYRYELSKEIDINKGVDRSEYLQLYNKNQEGSDYKPSDVHDPFQYL
jgi:hypothetical protein